MIKKLKFAEPLPSLILAGMKDSTWRINDDKNIGIEDVLSLCRVDGSEFAQARIRWVKSTRLGDLTPEDWEGHEPFASEEEMFATYLKYYNTPVTKDTVVKIIKFQLL